jgi:hypothetical protein
MSSIRVENDDIISGNIFNAFPDTSSTVDDTSYWLLLNSFVGSLNLVSINGILIVIWFFSLTQCLYQLTRSSPRVNIKDNE